MHRTHARFRGRYYRLGHGLTSTPAALALSRVARRSLRRTFSDTVGSVSSDSAAVFSPKDPSGFGQGANTAIGLFCLSAKYPTIAVSIPSTLTINIYPNPFPDSLILPLNRLSATPVPRFGQVVSAQGEQTAQEYSAEGL